MGKKDTAFFVKMEQDLLDRLKAVSERMNVSKSAIVRMGLVQLIEEFEKTAKKKEEVME